MIQETGWGWEEIRGTRLSRLWMLFRFWAGRGAARFPPAPSSEEIAAALSRIRK